MTWQYAEAAHKPPEFDHDSSHAYVTCRRNYSSFEREGVPMWKWEERKMLKEDWEAQCIADGELQDTADMAYVNSELALAILEEL